MIGYVTLGTNDLKQAGAFYDRKAVIARSPCDEAIQCFAVVWIASLRSQ